MQKVKNLFCENRGRKLAVLLLGAFGYALLTALCSQIEQFGATAWSRTLARFAAAFPIAFVVLAALLAIAMPKLMCRPRESQKPFCTWGAALLFFACYTPMLLIEFPGSFTYDVTAQTFQIAKNSYSMFYPLAHTLLLKFCLDAYGLLQSFEKCALLCSAIQMTLVSICFALVCASISRACSRRAARIAAAFFALCPYHAVFASNFTKDVLFAAFLAVFVAYTLEYVQAGGLCARRMAMCVFAGMMACLLRNNMIYAMLVWVALLLVFGRGHAPRGLLGAAGGGAGHGRQSGAGCADACGQRRCEGDAQRSGAAAFPRVHACPGNLHGRRNGCHGYILWQRGLHAL